jgi:hypothetical protein
MRRALFILSLWILVSCDISSQVINKIPLSPRITGYNIEAKLNTGNRSIEGKMEAFWVNQTTETVPDIQLHLYMNAFKSSKSTLNTELGRTLAKDSTLIGRVDIISFTCKDGTDFLPMVRYIHPDDNNKSDSTVIDVLLPKPAKPGDTVAVSISFVTKLPSEIRRTGYAGNFYFAGQWFPKFGVYEPAGMRQRRVGGWNCHQFHAHSEFYSDHSVYNVKITVPKDYVVGTGGMLMGEFNGEGNTKIQTWRAEDIADFAWTAWPGFAVFTQQWKHVKITLLIPKTRLEQVDRQFTAVKNSLEYFDKYVGPYPWPHLTVVDPPAIGSGSGGMEYTTLFTSESFYRAPAQIHFPEMVTVHEFGHAYFMGILASNEFEEPWMDEGINQFWEERIVDNYWGENSGIMDFPILKISDKSISRLTYARSDTRQVVSNNEYSWNYPHGTYGMMSYMKTSTWLYTLMGIIGEDATNQVFKEYYKKWAFKHPSGKDFVNVVNEVVTRIYGNKFGPDMNWFFDQTLYGTGICDYKVEGISNCPSGLKTKKDTISDMVTAIDSSKKSVVRLDRAGDIMLPVEVLVHFKDGDEIHESWDGKSTYKDYTYYGGKQIQWVKIDPDYKIKMDVNFINNSMTVDQINVPIRRFSDKILSFMQFLISIVTL